MNAPSCDQSNDNEQNRELNSVFNDNFKLQSKTGNPKFETQFHLDRKENLKVKNLTAEYNESA